MTVICKICEKVFTNRSHLNRHVRNVHKSIPTPVCYDKSRWNYKCLEEKCNISFRQNPDLISHLKLIHKKAFDEVEEIIFPDKTAFESWKCKIELENNCNYVVSTHTGNTKGKVIYYNCNRTKVGTKLRENTSRQRRLKKQGSCKLDFACTSRVKLTIGEGEWLVQWQKEHYGHRSELQHLRISRQDKSTIASKLISGGTITKIIDSTRDKTGTPLKRVDLLTHKDIDNIKRRYKIKAKDENGAESLDPWIQECQSMPVEENPILLYKRQGESSDILDPTDFCLILMNQDQQMMLATFGNDVIAVDGTHGLTNYDFELTTIMVIDEFGQGFPACYMFSNRKDAYIYELLFKSVELKVGNICGKTFMSDITDTFYNAWCRVMGPVMYRLLCSWHVDRAWQKNLTKIADEEKRAEVYNTLKVLQGELDEKRFKAQLMSALNLMLQDEVTADFGLYFKMNYANICEQWAHCFRKSAGINTNMRLESMHKTIKHFYLDHKKVKRLDKGLYAVLKFTRAKIVERMNKLEMNQRKEITNNNILLEEINQTFIKLQNCDLNNLSDEVKLQIHAHLKFVNNLVDLPRTNFNHRENKFPTLKNIDAQLRFFSTQRRRRINENNNTTNKKEKISISNLLSGKPEEFIADSSVNDHSYF